MSQATSSQPSPDWNKLLAPYRGAVTWKSFFQLGTTAVLFAGFWAAMLWSLDVGYWLTLLLAIPAGTMLIRLFMLQHD